MQPYRAGSGRAATSRGPALSTASKRGKATNSLLSISTPISTASSSLSTSQAPSRSSAGGERAGAQRARATTVGSSKSRLGGIRRRERPFEDGGSDDSDAEERKAAAHNSHAAGGSPSQHTSLHHKLASLSGAARTEAVLAAAASTDSLFSVPIELGRMPPQASDAQFTDDGPPESVRLLSAAVAKQRRAAARAAAKAAKQEQDKQRAAAVGGRVLVLHDEGGSSDGTSDDSDAAYQLTEAEAAALGWEATAEVLANMHTASDATSQRAEIAKQNRRVRRTLAQVQRRVERTVKDFRRRTAQLRADVDSDEEDILGSTLRDQLEAGQAPFEGKEGGGAVSWHRTVTIQRNPLGTQHWQALLRCLLRC